MLMFTAGLMDGKVHTPRLRKVADLFVKTYQQAVQHRDTWVFCVRTSDLLTATATVCCSRYGTVVVCPSVTDVLWLNGAR